MKDKSKTVIDKKLLFEICDAIIHSDGSCFYDDYSNRWCCNSWDKKFLDKVKNIRNNS